MKIFRYISLLLFVLTTTITAVNGAEGKANREMWDRANTLYVNGDYKGAIEVYDSISMKGYVSSELFYNTGNAYFKDGKIGKSIVYFNKAQRLAPTNSDISYNLSVANSYVKDKVNSVPEFYVNSMLYSLRKQFTSAVWAAMSLIFLAVGLAALLVYLLAEKIKQRKMGFYGAAVMLVFFIITTLFAVAEYNSMVNGNEAIVVSSVSPVKSSPDRASQDIFILHEGTMVEVLNEYGSWSEVEIADGNKGWLRTATIQTIN